jgi:hypothetical protein
MVRRHLPTGAVEDLKPSVELLVMLTVIMPLTADVSGNRECCRDFFATEASDEAQMLRVCLARIVNYTGSKRSVPAGPGDAPVPSAGRPGFRVRLLPAELGRGPGPPA